ncbi:MAG: AAA family ATPase [Sulfurovum sp.]
MKLRSLHIEDYKLFKDFDIDFLDLDDKPLPIVVLAGVNGSGKSTLLEFITKEYKEDIIYFPSGIDDIVGIESLFVKYLV